MAVATRETEIIITLVIDGPEAEFLRDLTQNYLGSEELIEAGFIRNESIDEQTIRESIHNTIDKQLRKRK